MSRTLIRDAGVLAQVRHPERLISVRAVPYGDPVKVDDGRGPYLEQWDRTTWETLRDQPPVLLDHDLRRPVGKVVSIQRGKDGIYADLRMTDGLAAADDALALAADGVYRVSVGFSSVASEKRGPVLVRRHVVNHEISLTVEQALPGAHVLDVRGKAHPRPRLGQARAWLRDHREETPA
jgi:HK97 family phage prohead protease